MTCQLVISSCYCCYLRDQVTLVDFHRLHKSYLTVSRLDPTVAVDDLIAAPIRYNFKRAFNHSDAPDVTLIHLQSAIWCPTNTNNILKHGKTKIERT